MLPPAAPEAHARLLDDLRGGLILVGIALLGHDGLAGAAAYVLAHGLAKAGLFLCVGIILFRLSSVDELRLRGRGRALAPTAVIFTLGALAMTGIPPVGTFLGKSLIEESASRLGYGWVPAVMTAVSIVSVAAILRAAARIFLGWGDARDPLLSPEPDESGEVEHPPRRRPPIMLVPAAALVLASLGLSVVPGLERGLKQQAARFQDRPAYAQAVLSNPQPGTSASPGLDLPTFASSSIAYGLASALGAVALALFGLYRPRLARRLPSTPLRLAAAGIAPLRAAHSGVVTDYVTWVMVGTAGLGGIFALTLTS